MKLKSDHLGTCVQVKTAAGVGTCFFRRIGTIGRFLSAAHVFKGVRAGESIYFRDKDGWSPFTVRELIFDPNGYDVCAFTLDNLNWDTEAADQRAAGLWPGDPVCFLGFPHGLSNTYPSETGFVTPLTRRAHLSGVIQHLGQKLVVYDGFNNPGYSGGPIYADAGDDIPTLVGLISGYRPEAREKSLVYRKGSKDSEEPVEGLFVKPNSGMIIAISIAQITITFESLATSNYVSLISPKPPKA